MKKCVLCLCLLLSALSLAALQCGEKAVELPVLKYLNGNRFSVAVPLPDNQLRIVTFVHTYARGAQSTVNMLNALSHLHKSRIRQIVITPDPESDALALAKMFRQSGIAFAVDSSRRTTQQYMAGSLLYPKSFVIDRKGTVIWCGETVDLGEMLQSFFAGTFDAAAAEKISPMLDELQTLLRESSERKMKQLTDKIFAISPAHPGALRMRLFALENSNRIPQAWALLQERINAAPAAARLYFTAMDFVGRYTYFKRFLPQLLFGFEQHVKDTDPRCMMAWELLKRFQYDLQALEYAHILLGKTAPASGEIRKIWFAARAQAAYMTGDVSKAIYYQQQCLPGNAAADPRLQFFKGVEKLKKRL